jgi:hypothetical protein
VKDEVCKESNPAYVVNVVMKIELAVQQNYKIFETLSLSLIVFNR